MNTIEDLMNHGIDRYTAERMLEDYKKRIGTMNGVYKIVDIKYDFDERGKDITLQCSSCGKIIHRMMIQGRNKWSELIKTCKDCEDRKRKDDLKKFEKKKKEEILSHIGKTYGDYLITDVKFGMQVSGTFAIVEYADGTIHEVEPTQIRFVDNAMSEYVFPEMEEKE